MYRKYNLSVADKSWMIVVYANTQVMGRGVCIVCKYTSDGTRGVYSIVC